jgi:hypothetical protein
VSAVTNVPTSAIQESQWAQLYDALRQALDRFGKDDAFGKGDYWLMDENWGIYQQKLDIQNLRLIRRTL